MGSHKPIVKPRIPHCKVSQDIVQRVTVIGPYDEGKDVLNKLFEQGFRVVRSGPYTNRTMHPTLDMTRFLFIAERIVD